MPEWLTGFNFLLAVLSLLVLVGAAIVILMARRKDTTHTIQEQRITATDGLLKIKEQELEICKGKLKETSEELDEQTAEYRALADIKIQELMVFHKDYTRHKAEVVELKETIEILRVRLGDKQS